MLLKIWLQFQSVQGHTSYGRYAKKVGGGNVLDLLAAPKNGNKSLSLYGSTAEILRAPGTANLVRVQEVNSQQGRELAQTEMINAADFAESGSSRQSPS